MSRSADSAAEERSHPANRRRCYVNRHGRRGGRGVRPWLITGKLIAVAGALGGMIAGAMLCWLEQAEAAAALAHRLVLPSLAAAAVFGLVLLVHHGVVLWNQRWLQVKLAVLLVAVPPLGWLLYTQSAEPNELAPMRMGATFIAMSVVLAIVAWLGRVKPRLGQWPRRRGG